MKHFSKYSDSTLHEATKTTSIKYEYKVFENKRKSVLQNKKPLEIQYKILNEENTNLQYNSWPFNG